MDRRQFLALAAALAPIPAFTDARLLRAAAAAQIPWTDVHVHPISDRGGRGSGASASVGSQSAGTAVDAAAAVMEGSSISTMFLLPPPQIYLRPQLLDYPSFIGPSQKYGARFRFLGGGGTLNPLLHQFEGTQSVSDAALRQFSEEAEAILRAGAVGFGEIAAHHLSLAPAHPYESVPADHPLLLRLADIAARHDVPIDLHFDPVIERMTRPDWAPETNPADLAPNFAAFERLLAYNRGARIVWAHAGSDNLGQWTPELSHRMLATHPNLFMSLRLAPAHAPQNHPLTITGELKPGWRQLLTDFPDRFVIGGDQFFVGDAGMMGPAALFATRAAPIRQRTNVFLSLLPEQLARNIAQANAARIYKL
jgi:hypothetical protein